MRRAETAEQRYKASEAREQVPRSHWSSCDTQSVQQSFGQPFNPLAPSPSSSMFSSASGMYGGMNPGMNPGMGMGSYASMPSPYGGTFGSFGQPRYVRQVSFVLHANCVQHKHGHGQSILADELQPLCSKPAVLHV